MKFGVCLVADEPLERLGALARRVEEAGFASVWVTDNQSAWRDVWAALTVVAQATSHIALGPMVTNPQTRHPMVTAVAAATVDELSAGRLVLGMGSGRASVRPLGGRGRAGGQLDACRRAVTEVRGFLRDGSGTFDGVEATAPPFARRPVPVFLSGSGPRMLALAGEVADGAIAVAGASPDLLAYARERVDAGLRAAGRDRGEVEFVYYVQCSVAADRAAAYDTARAMAGFYAAALPLPFELTGVDREAFRRAYDYGRHYRPDNPVAELVGDELVDRFVLAGTAEEVAKRVGDLARGDVDQIVIRPCDGDVAGFLRSAPDLLGDLATSTSPSPRVGGRHD